MRAWIILIAILLAGCSKLTAENYAKIETGMSYEEVSAILGKAASCDDVAGFQSCKWGDDQSNISVQLVGDRVVLHSANNLR